MPPRNPPRKLATRTPPHKKDKKALPHVLTFTPAKIIALHQLLTQLSVASPPAAAMRAAQATADYLATRLAKAELPSTIPTPNPAGRAPSTYKLTRPSGRVTLHIGAAALAKELGITLAGLNSNMARDPNRQYRRKSGDGYVVAEKVTDNRRKRRNEEFLGPSGEEKGNSPADA